MRAASRNLSICHSVWVRHYEEVSYVILRFLWLRATVIRPHWCMEWNAQLITKYWQYTSPWKDSFLYFTAFSLGSEGIKKKKKWEHFHFLKYSILITNKICKILFPNIFQESEPQRVYNENKETETRRVPTESWAKENFLHNFLSKGERLWISKHFHELKYSDDFHCNDKTLSIYLACGKIMNRPNYRLFWHLSCLLLWMILRL